MKMRGAGIAAGRTSQGALFANEVRNTELSQWFTNPKLAERIVEWAGLPFGARVLEPSAGDGAFVRAARARGLSTLAVEIDPRVAVRVPGEILVGDFLAMTPELLGMFNAVIMNPPYEDDADVAHVLHALQFAPRVIALLRSAFRHGAGRFEEFWRRVDAVRIAELVDRPKFGGDGGAMSDFAVFEFIWRGAPRRRGQRVSVEVEWW